MATKVLKLKLLKETEGYWYSPVHQARFTDCCKAYVTFHESTLCCKGCWAEVENEYLYEPALKKTPNSKGKK